MKEKHTRTPRSGWVEFATFCLFAAALICAMNGAFGFEAQGLAFCVGLGVAAFGLGLVMLGDWSQLGLHKSNPSIDANRCEDEWRIDEDTLRLQARLEVLESVEQQLISRYSRFECSQEELVRARANRLQAEIELISHQRRPKLWTDICHRERWASETHLRKPR